MTAGQRDFIARMLRERRRCGTEKRNSMLRLEADSWRKAFSAGRVEQHNRPFTNRPLDPTFGRYPWLSLDD